MRKATASHCDRCGRAWEDVADREFVYNQGQRAPSRQRGAYRNQDQERWGGGNQWVQPPRQPSRRRNQGRDQGAQQGQVRSSSQRGTKGQGKGRGKGQGPRAEAAPAIALPPPQQDPPWASAVTNMPMMPTPPAPPTPVYQLDPQTAELIAAVSKNPDSCGPEVQAAYHALKAKSAQQESKILHSAVTTLTRAKQELADAQLHRSNLHSSWIRFLQDSIAKWQDSGQQFQEQEEAAVNRIKAAQAKYTTACETLNRSKQETGISSSATANDEVVDLEEMDLKEVSTANSSKISDSLVNLQNSLQQLHQSAEELAAQEHVAKRPRVEADAAMGDPPLSGGTSFGAKAMEPFGKPDQKSYHEGFTKGGILLPSRQRNVLPRLRFPRLVQFATSVQVAICTNHDDKAQSFICTVQDFDDWADKPWSLYPGTKSFDRSKTPFSAVPCPFHQTAATLGCRALPRCRPSDVVSVDFGEELDSGTANPHVPFGTQLLLSWFAPGLDDFLFPMDVGEAQDSRSTAQASQPSERPQTRPGMHPPLPEVPRFAREVSNALSGRLQSYVPIDPTGPWVRVWYIHLEVHVRSFLARHVQLRGPPHTWEEQVLHLWEDVLIPDLATSIDLVSPTPPREASEVGLLCDLILAQGIGGTQVAGLVTARPIDPHSGPRQYSGAVPFPAAVDRQMILAGLDLVQVCSRRDCQVRHGRTVFSRTALHQMQPGYGFLIDIGRILSTAAPLYQPSYLFNPVQPIDDENPGHAPSCPNQLGAPLSLRAVSSSSGWCVCPNMPGLPRKSDLRPFDHFESESCPIQTGAPLSFQAVSSSSGWCVRSSVSVQDPQFSISFVSFYQDECSPIHASTPSEDCVKQCKINDPPDRDGALPERVPQALQPVPPPVGPVQPIVLPAFVHDMFLDLTEDFLQANLLERGFLVRTWYVHHRTIRRNRVSRCIHLRGPPHVWQAQILTVWFDVLVPLEAVEIDLVKPRPSRTRDERIIQFDLILSQGLELDRFAGLISVTPASPGIAVPRYAMAVSLPPEVDGLFLVNWCAFQQVCQTFQCMIFHRWNQLQLANTPVHMMQPGDCFEISVFTRVPALESTQTPGDGPPPDSTSSSAADMNCSSDSAEPSANQPQNQRSAPSSQASHSAASANPRRRVCLYRLGRPPVDDSWEWPLSGNLILAVANRLGVPLQAVVALHPLQAKPEAESLHDLSFIVQMYYDLPVGSSDQLLLFDVIVHQRGSPSCPRSPTFQDRRVVRSRNLITRLQVLEYAHLADYCQFVSDRCLVVRNSELWLLQDTVLRHVSHGAYLKIIVPPPISSSVNVLSAIQTVEDLGNVVPEHSFVVQYPVWDRVPADQPVPGSAGVGRNVGSKHVGAADFYDHSRLGFVEHANDDQRQDPPEFARSVDLAPFLPPGGQQLPPVHDLPTFLFELGITFRDRAVIDFEDQGPILNVQTWYVHHLQHLRCTRPVTVQLESDPATWPEILTAPWRHLLQPGALLAFREVRPTPPRLFRDRQVVHIILEQGLHMPMVAALTSVLLQGLHHDGTAQLAISIEPRVSAEDLVRHLQLEARCQVYRCSVWSGVQTFRPSLAEEIFSGIGIYVHVHSHDCRHLLLDFGDQPFWHVGAFVPAASSHGPAPERRAPALLPPGYGRSLQVLKDATDHDAHLSGSFLPDLTTAWQIYLAQTPQGPYRFQVISWYCDHHRLPRSNEGRLVTLQIDPSTWRDTLCATWSDWIQPDLEVSFYLVRPTPLGPDALVGHVILAQNQLPRHVSVLVSSTLPGENAWEPVHRVVRLPEVVDHHMLIHEGGLMNMCPPMTFGLECRSWIDMQELTDGHLYLASSGDGFLTTATESSPAIEMHSHHSLNRIHGLFAKISDLLTDLTGHVVKAMDSVATTLDFSSADDRPSHLMDSPYPDVRIVCTWFLHFAHHRVCYHPRQVHILEPSAFEGQFHSTWLDKCGEETSLAFFWVAPDQVLGIVSDPSSQDKAILAESSHLTEGRNLTLLRATFVPSPISPADVRSIFGLPVNPSGHSQLQHCRYFLRDDPIQEDVSYPVQHGDCIALTWHQRDIASSHIRVDFDCVLRAHEYLDGHFFLPTYDLPPAFPWFPTSWTWATDAPWWQPGLPVDAVRIYYDGSSLSKAQGNPAGCAVAAFVFSSGSWMFAGAISSALRGETSSYSAELHAAIVAHKFLHDLLKLMAISQPHPPYVELCYDSETVGHQASGEWQVLSHPIMGQFLRSLHRCLETKLSCTINHRHVTAHTGEPGNELVDTLAFQAASGHPLHELTPWFDHILSKPFVSAAEWMWYLFRPDLLWEGSYVLFPAGPSSVPPQDVFPQKFMQERSIEEGTSGVLDVCFATCNVLSLLPTTVKCRDPSFASARVGPARQESLLQQFHDAGVHIFAWQETRLRQMSNRHDERYWLYRSTANEHGQYGILVGLHRTLPVGQIERPGSPTQNVYLRDTEVAVIAASPRFLILRLDNPLLKCVLIAGHAPHTGAGEATIHRWWSDLEQSIPPSYRTWEFVLLADANARIGSEPCNSIGDHQAEECDSRSEGFTNFVRQYGLWIPATFDHCHQGPGVTWRHARGNWSRNDYVCLPSLWNLDACESWISEDIDASLAKEDHRPALVHVRRRVVPFPSLQSSRSPKLVFDHVDTSVLEKVAQPNWTIDVHTHCHDLQQSIVQSLWSQRRLPTRKPMRQTMSDTTWTLVQEKRSVRNLLVQRSHAQRQTLLEAWFACWRHAVHDCPFQLMAVSFDRLLSHQDQLIALAYQEFRCLGRHVTRALKQDDIAFFSSLLADCSEFLHPSQAKNLWQIVRRSLPKFQQRRLNLRPFQFAALDDQWLPHYCELEAGVPISSTQLLDDCVMSQARNRLDAPLQLALADLPSLTQLEQTFRATSAGKSTGHDVLPSELFHKAAKDLALLHHDLIVKTYLWQSEPIQAKGGPVALIPKVVHPVLAKQFRGILLLPSAGKRAHAILRSQIMTALWPARSQGQMGGFPAQQVIFGSHAIRTFGVLCDSHDLSSAILFLDLSSAFHHLIREVVVGSNDGYNLAPVLDVLTQSKHPADSFKHFGKLPGILEELGVSMPIVRLLRDMHFGTWCSLHDKWLLRTHRGTRPGSPLADIIFHTLMARVAHSMDHWLRDQHEYQRLLHDLDIEVPSVIWADDIAIPLATKHADHIVPFLQSALQQARDELHRYGFSLNFAKGKTSAVLTFRGPHASDLRKKHQLHDHAGITCQFSDGQEAWLHLVPVYRHLGTLFASSHSLTCELKARVGIAKRTFAQLSKPLLTNRNLPTRIRLQMFHVLVTSKMSLSKSSEQKPGFVSCKCNNIRYFSISLLGCLVDLTPKLQLCPSCEI
eukprot:s730_g16.t1